MKIKIILAAGLIAVVSLGGCMSPTRAIDRVKVDSAHPESLGVKKIEALEKIGVAAESNRPTGWWYPYPGYHSDGYIVVHGYGWQR